MSIAIKRNFTIPSSSAIGASEIFVSSSVASTSIDTGALRVSGGVGVSGDLSLGGVAKFFNGSFFTAFSSSATASTTYYWPSTSPGSGTSVLSSDAAGNMSWVLMSASGSGLTLNGLSSSTQFFSTLISGTGFTLSSLGSTHSFHIGLAGNGSTGLISSTTQTIFGLKTFASGIAITTGTASTNTTSGDIVVTGGVGIGSSVNIGGKVGIGTNNLLGQLNIKNPTASTSSIIIQGATSQSEDYLKIFSSSGTTTFSISSAGRLSWPSSSPAQVYNTSYSSQGRIVVSGNLYVNPGPFIVDTGAGEASMTSTSITFGGVGWGSYGSPARISTDNAVRIQPTSTSVVPLVVQLQNASWTSGNALEIQNNGTLKFKVDYAGSTTILSTTGSATTSTGALVVYGGVGIGESLNVYRTSTFNDNLIINSAKEARFYNSSSTFYTAIKAGITTSSVTYILPLTDGSANQVLYTDGSSGLGWTTIVAGSATSSITSGSAGTSITAGSAGTATNAGSAGTSITAGSAGTASNSANVNVVLDTTNTIYLTGSRSGTSIGSTASYVLSGISALGNTLTATTFAGSLSGTASSASLINTTAATTTKYLIGVNLNTSAGSTQLFTGSGITIGDNRLTSGSINITSGSASTNTSTGALTVSGGVGITGQLSVNTIALGSTGVAVTPTMTFVGSAGTVISMSVLSDTTLAWEGSSGQLFSIDNNLSSGEIFSVNDISGLPIISASAGQTITLNEFGGFTQVGSGLASTSTTTGALRVVGGLGVTGNANIGGTVRITNTTAATGVSSAAFTVSGGVGIGQSLYLSGSKYISGATYSGLNTFTKTIANGDIALDNGASDTPAILYYWANNKNIGTDVYYAGSGTTKFRVVKELNESGGAELWSVDRNGIVTQTAWDVGEVIASRMYNYSDLGMSATTTISSTSYTTFATITYTPKSSTSYLWIEFSATYIVTGTSVDDHWSNIEVNGSEIVNANQIWTNATGGGTRSGVLFPIAGRYTNTGTAGIAISVRAKRGTSDDNNTIYGNTGSGYMRIQEIGR